MVDLGSYSGGMSTTLHVIDTGSWVSRSFEAYAARHQDRLSVITHHALSPVTGMKPDDAVWTSPGALIAQNAWQTRKGLSPLVLEAPPTGWLASVPHDMLHRCARAAEVREILTWTAFPEGLGDAPWSQLSGGRPLSFPAARRSLPDLQDALLDAPEASVIDISEHLESLTEEWYVVVHRDLVAASSGYCIHEGAGSRRIRTVFDNAVFHDGFRIRAEDAALRCARQTGLHTAGMLIGFDPIHRTPSVLEADPVWCSAPYAYTDRQMGRFIDAIAQSRLEVRGSVAADHGGRPASSSAYRPDPWMVRQFERRYRSF
jgi:hypothetical protein